MVVSPESCSPPPQNHSRRRSLADPWSWELCILQPYLWTIQNAGLQLLNN
ncbi:Hypothetical protein FKW44_019796 [Caligus rogercresseyi]|uniref:Uncharacterized protein n=1 Tax=Caligus rogercresseyi TaxID=217165 RepID=A0A7T8JXM9_CALRO|nr:Hypothetical protein FKW44_019796 [Caligus rogercresseyi]